MPSAKRGTPRTAPRSTSTHRRDEAPLPSGLFATPDDTPGRRLNRYAREGRAMSRQPSPELARILHRLDGVTRSGDGYQACCPAHDDGTASLSLSDGRKGVVLYCHAGCTADDVTAALGLSASDLFAPDPTRAPPARTLRRAPALPVASRKPKDYGTHEAFYFYEERRRRAALPRRAPTTRRRIEDVPATALRWERLRVRHEVARWEGAPRALPPARRARSLPRRPHRVRR